MKITVIKSQVKREGRYSVFVEGQYEFSLSAEGLLDAGITQGQELTQTELNEYKKQSQMDKAYGLTLAYIARRMRSEGELTDYWRRKGYDEEFERTVLSKLKRQGLVDDVEFARAWVANRRLLKSTSTRKLQVDLRQKKISDDIIKSVLTEDETDERQLLRDLVTKKRRQTRYQDDQKLIAYLARQGFAYDDIKAVLHSDQ